MNYNEALEYIHSINWTFCKPGLERTKELCKRLGNPEKSLKFIHVAGTNGKGSFCAMLSSVLKETGIRVGTYTSPYVKVFNERMMVNGEMISNEELAEITEYIKPIADSMEDKPTEFELITAIAFEYFKRKKCQLVVLECGLGGRLDSTNVVENVLLSVITGIALDHTSILGNTISEIAREKAGIIKENTPVLFCGTGVEAQRPITEVAKTKNAPVFFVDRESVNIKKQTLDGTIFDYELYKNLEISLLGKYQVENATNVLQAIRLLNNHGFMRISEDSIRRGLKNAKWHARFEVILDTPLMIFDGGHNPEGVCKAVESIKAYLGEKRVYTITGVMADKDYNFIASKISEVSKKVFCITPNNERALNSESYKEVFLNLGIEAESFDTIESAINSSIEQAKKDNGVILCLGSLYMYGEVSEIVGRHRILC